MLVMAVLLTAVSAADGDVTIDQDDNTNGCNGVRTTRAARTPTSSSSAARSSQGGTAAFLITYPVDPEDVAGREEFEITDCVFIEDTAVLKFFISFVPNTEDFELTLTPRSRTTHRSARDLQLRQDDGGTVATRRRATARQARPASSSAARCASKVDGNDDPLAGADFDIDCDWPTSSFLPDTIIIADGDTETINSVSGGPSPRGHDRLRWRDQRPGPGGHGVHVHRDRRTRRLRAAGGHGVHDHGRAR